MDKYSKLMEYLSSNCRMSNIAIAKSLREPKHVIAYRRKKLTQEKKIIGYETVINFEALGFKTVVVYLTFSRYWEVKERVHKCLNEHPNTIWAAEVFPSYNVKCTLVIKNVAQVERILDEIEENVKDKITKKEILLIQNTMKKESYSTLKPKDKRNQKVMQLGKRERKLIKALSLNAAASLTSLAKDSGFSIEGVKNKIKQFQKSGIIIGFETKFDKTKIGINFWGQIFVRVRKLDKNYEKLRNLIYSDLVYGRTRQVFGSFNVEMAILTPTYQKLVDIVTSLEKNLKEDFESYTLLITTKKIVDHRLPEFIFST